MNLKSTKLYLKKTTALILSIGMLINPSLSFADRPAGARVVPQIKTELNARLIEAGLRSNGVSAYGSKGVTPTRPYPQTPIPSFRAELRPKTNVFGTPSQTGRLELRRPNIGYLYPIADEDKDLSQGLIAGEEQALWQAKALVREGVDAIVTETGARAKADHKKKNRFAKFDENFERLIYLTQGDMEAFARPFVEILREYNASNTQKVNLLLEAVRKLAQNGGTPIEGGFISYFDPARYLYAKFHEEEVAQFSSEIIAPLADAIKAHATAENLNDVREKLKLIDQVLIPQLDPQFSLGKHRHPDRDLQYEIEYDSIVMHQDGEISFVVKLLLFGMTGVAFDFRVVIPAEVQAAYDSPFPLLADQTSRGTNYEVGLRDSIHFAHTRFQERIFASERDFYDARIAALQKTGQNKSSIRFSNRGHESREATLRAAWHQDASLKLHLTLVGGSEHRYGGQFAPRAVASTHDLIDDRGTSAVTPSMLREDPSLGARSLEELNRPVAISFENDHERPNQVEDLDGFASDVMRMFQAMASSVATQETTGFLHDEGTQINKDFRADMVKKIEEEFSHNEVSPELFELFKLVYDTGSNIPGITSPMEFNWIRNVVLKQIFVQVYGETEGLRRHSQIYVEPDVALDKLLHHPDEMAHITINFWISAMVHGYKMGPVVTSYGNVHGVSAGDPSLDRAKLLLLMSQAAMLYSMPINEEPEILAIAQKAPAGLHEKWRKILNNSKFTDRRLAALLETWVTSIPERTPSEEDRLQDFKFRQMRSIPKELMRQMKDATKLIMASDKAENKVYDLMTQIEAKKIEMQKEGADTAKLAAEAEELGKQLSQALQDAVEPVKATQSALKNIEDSLQSLLNKYPERRLLSTTHAGSGLRKALLKKAKDALFWAANKSTEQRMITLKMRHIAYLMAVDPTQGEKELNELPFNARKIWDLYQPSDEELQEHAKLFAAQFDEIRRFALAKGEPINAETGAYAKKEITPREKQLAALKKDLKKAKAAKEAQTIEVLSAQTEALKAEIKTHKKEMAKLGEKAIHDPRRPFHFSWLEGQGWSPKDKKGHSHKNNEWLTGKQGRFFDSLEATDAGQGVDRGLLFPNAAEWGTPLAIRRLVDHLIFNTILFYHAEDGLNAKGTGQEYRDFIKMKNTAEMAKRVEELTRVLDPTRTELRARVLAEPVAVDLNAVIDDLDARWLSSQRFGVSGKDVPNYQPIFSTHRQVTIVIPRLEIRNAQDDRQRMEMLYDEWASAGIEVELTIRGSQEKPKGRITSNTFNSITLAANKQAILKKDILAVTLQSPSTETLSSRGLRSLFHEMDSGESDFRYELRNAPAQVGDAVSFDNRFFLEKSIGAGAKNNVEDSKTRNEGVFYAAGSTSPTPQLGQRIQTESSSQGSLTVRSPFDLLPSSINKQDPNNRSNSNDTSSAKRDPMRTELRNELRTTVVIDSKQQRPLVKLDAHNFVRVLRVQKNEDHFEADVELFSVSNEASVADGAPIKRVNGLRRGGVLEGFNHAPFSIVAVDPAAGKKPEQVVFARAELRGAAVTGPLTRAEYLNVLQEAIALHGTFSVEKQYDQEALQALQVRFFEIEAGAPIPQSADESWAMPVTGQEKVDAHIAELYNDALAELVLHRNELRNDENIRKSSLVKVRSQRAEKILELIDALLPMLSSNLNKKVNQTKTAFANQSMSLENLGLAFELIASHHQGELSSGAQKIVSQIIDAARQELRLPADKAGNAAQAVESVVVSGTRDEVKDYLSGQLADLTQNNSLAEVVDTDAILRMTRNIRQLLDQLDSNPATHFHVMVNSRAEIGSQYSLRFGKATAVQRDELRNELAGKRVNEYASVALDDPRTRKPENPSAASFFGLGAKMYRHDRAGKTITVVRPSGGMRQPNAQSQIRTELRAVAEKSAAENLLTPDAMALLLKQWENSENVMRIAFKTKAAPQYGRVQIIPSALKGKTFFMIEGKGRYDADDVDWKKSGISVANWLDFTDWPATIAANSHVQVPVVLRNELRKTVKDESILSWKSKHDRGIKPILDKFVKEYDFRGFDGSDDKNFPQEVDETVLRWIGRSLGSADFYSRRHNQHVQLKAGDTFVIAGDNGPSTQAFKNSLIEGLRDTGVNVIDLGITVSGQLYKSIRNLNAQGGLYVTRSHVEVGTNGAKPNIGGITLYGEMLQAVKEQILQAEYEAAGFRGTLNQSEEIRAKSKARYLQSLREQYKDLPDLLKEANMKVTFNLNSGSATEYVDFFKEMFGPNITLLKSEGDPWARKGLADPSRGDAKALAHPAANIVQYSSEHPDLFILNFDLDVDRVSLLQKGNL